MRLQEPLAVVTPTVDGDVLATLASTNQSFTTGELHRLLGRHSHSGIRKVLLRLQEQGIVESERFGNVTTFRLNQDHLAAPAISELARLRYIYFDRLRETFGSWRPAPVFAAMFGSAARGEMRNSSDIDLFVVRPDDLDTKTRDEWDENLRALQQMASRWTGNDVRAIQMDESEVIDNLAHEPLLESIRFDGVVLHGTSSFWRRAYAKNGRMHTGDS